MVNSFHSFINPPFCFSSKNRLCCLFPEKKHPWKQWLDAFSRNEKLSQARCRGPEAGSLIVSRWSTGKASNLCKTIIPPANRESTSKALQLVNPSCVSPGKVLESKTSVMFCKLKRTEPKTPWSDSNEPLYRIRLLTKSFSSLP